VRLAAPLGDLLGQLLLDKNVEQVAAVGTRPHAAEPPVVFERIKPLAVFGSLTRVEILGQSRDIEEAKLRHVGSGFDHVRTGNEWDSRF
jgi:hypothetical protein